MSGTLGNLSAAQQQAVDELRASELSAHQTNETRLREIDRARIQRLEQRAATEQELNTLAADRETEWPHELLRFLRAAKFDVGKARENLQRYYAWRVSEGIDTILEGLPFNLELMDRVVGTKREGEDKLGRCEYIEKSGSVNPDIILSLFTDLDVTRCYIWAQEDSARRARLQSRKHARNLESFAQVLDVGGAGKAHQRALKITKNILKIFERFYPERLGNFYVVNTPWIFGVLWPIIRVWLDPVTKAKVLVLKGDHPLLEYFPPEHLPPEYGGTAPEIPHFTTAQIAELLPYNESNVPMRTETIKSGKSVTVTAHLEAGQVFEWCWRMLNAKDDIDFSVTFQPDDASQPLIEVVQTCRIEAAGLEGLICPQASYQCRAAGTITWMLDNHFSWVSSKEVQFWTNVTDHRTEATSADAERRRAASTAASAASAS